MKKRIIMSIIGAAFMAVTLSACSSVRTQADGQAGATEQTSQTTKSKVDADASASIKGAASDQKKDSIQTVVVPSFIFLLLTAAI